MRNITATGTIYGKTITVKKIQKRTAKKLYDQGIPIYFQASNLRPFGMWQSLLLIVDKHREYRFENVCKDYMWYNCDKERGRYINFYTDIKMVK